MSGAAFAVGNLLLARQMPTAQYAALSLSIAVFVVASHVSTLGYSQVALRQPVVTDRRMLVRLLAQGALGGALVALAGMLWHDQAPGPALLLMLLITCGPLIWVSGSALLRRGRKGGAYAVHTMPDWVILALGVMALWAPRWASSSALAAYCVIVSVLAVVGWMAHRAVVKDDAAGPKPIQRRLLISTTAIVAGGILMIQLERLAIGWLLDAQALAMFSVLASIAVFPFRLVTAGTNFTLVPGLQRLADPEGRRRLIRRELQVIGTVLVATSAVLALVGPELARWITAGRYAPTPWLVLAACLAGAAKVCQGIPRAIITACGTDAQMGRLSQFVWLGVALSVLGALAGAWAGLPGLLCGIAAGSIAGALPAMRMARRVIGTPPMSG